MYTGYCVSTANRNPKETTEDNKRAKLSKMHKENRFLVALNSQLVTCVQLLTKLSISVFSQLVICSMVSDIQSFILKLMRQYG